MNSMTTHQFEENCEILGRICEEYGLYYRMGHCSVHVSTKKNMKFDNPLLLFDFEEDLSNPDWDSIREELCSFSIEGIF